MKDINKYRGIIPAFYACYAPDGSISTEGVKALTRHLIAKGVKRLRRRLLRRVHLPAPG